MVVLKDNVVVFCTQVKDNLEMSKIKKSHPKVTLNYI